jgi:hypothetical protein
LEEKITINSTQTYIERAGHESYVEKPYVEVVFEPGFGTGCMEFQWSRKIKKRHKK